MLRQSFAATAVMSAVLIAGISSTACSREEPAAPVAEVQTKTPVQSTNQPLTVSGCLRAGEASDTFVLTASQSATATEPATYQLVGGRNLDLQGHIGQRVEVNGTLSAQQSVESRTPSTPAPGERATGTTGTPTVQTTTEVSFKRLEVSGVKPLGEKCES